MIIDEEEVLLDSAIIAGKILMENGAEMHRIEDTMNRILRGSELVEDAMSFVIPSGIFITGQSGNNTKMKRITKRTTNLQKVAFPLLFFAAIRAFAPSRAPFALAVLLLKTQNAHCTSAVGRMSVCIPNG